MRKIFNIITILTLGALGSIIFQAFILPHLANHEYFSNWSVIKNLKREAIINPVEKIIIEENQLVEESYQETQRILAGFDDGSGFLATADGSIITLAEVLPQDPQENYLFLEGEKREYEMVKIDYEKNLALLKIEGNNFSTCSFIGLDAVNPAQPVFLSGLIMGEEGIQKIFNQGVVKTIEGNLIKTNIVEEKMLRGSPLFNVKGEIIGINDIDDKGKIVTLTIDEIRKFAGF
jgi:S1-C subfamily serine protease